MCRAKRLRVLVHRNSPTNSLAYFVIGAEVALRGSDREVLAQSLPARAYHLGFGIMGYRPPHLCREILVVGPRSPASRSPVQ